MSTEEPTILMWFRAEQIEVVNWAGNPHKAVDVARRRRRDPHPARVVRGMDGAGPRPIRGRWTREEIEAAERLKRTMFEARQNRRMRELNRDLAATIADKESLIAQKDYLMGEVNHRVQNSLQLVSAFLGLASARRQRRAAEHASERSAAAPVRGGAGPPAAVCRRPGRGGRSRALSGGPGHRACGRRWTAAGAMRCGSIWRRSSSPPIARSMSG